VNLHPDLNRPALAIKQHVAFFKFARTFDIMDPADGKVLMTATEPSLGFINCTARFLGYTGMAPFHIVVTAADGTKLLQVKRGWTVFRSEVQVLTPDDKLVGTFRQKLLSIGGAFSVLDSNGQEKCDLSGSWTSWEFRFKTSSGTELGLISKKWAGLAKEFFTSADNYVLSISETVPPDDPLRLLLVGAVVCIDLVLKEGK
jgi:uncharacterized protein YxjI